MDGLRVIIVVVLVALAPRAGHAQRRQLDSPDGASAVELSFAGPIELELLVDYTSERLGVNFIYQDLGGKSVIVRAPREVPQSALLDLLSAALRTQALVLAESSQPGWFTIVPDSELIEVVQSFRTADDESATDVPEIRVFSTNHLGPRRADALIKPYLSKPGGTSTPFDDLGVLIVTDRGSVIRKVARLIEATDIPGQGTEIRYFPIAHGVAAEVAAQAQSIMSKLAGGSDGPSIEFVIEERSSQIIAVGDPALIDRAATIIEQLDAPVPQDRLPVRIYRLEHAAAEDILATLTSLDLTSGISSVSVHNVGESTNLPSGPMEEPDADGRSRSSRELDDGPNVIADINTNTIIVTGDLEAQRVYADLIRALDRRRPQVTVELTSVLLDTSGGYSLGVELGGRIGGDPRSLLFSAFGLSTRGMDGEPTPSPGAGLSGFVISPGDFDIVLRALETSGRARITTSPRLLVNDNATGRLTSTSQEPFESVNASDTVSTTTFGGYAEAGTTLVLTPHISETGFVQLEYSITLSSFSGDRVGDLPPPRQENTIESIVTLPDSFAIVTGGLQVTNETGSDQRVPGLGRLPLIGGLFRSELENSSELTLFLFIRPAIEKDMTFAGLKKATAASAAAVGLDQDWPRSEPMMMLEATPP